MPITIPSPVEIELVAWLSGRLTAEGIKAYSTGVDGAGAPDPTQLLFPWRPPEADTPAVCVSVEQGYPDAKGMAGFYGVQIGLMAQGPDLAAWQNLWLVSAEIERKVSEGGKAYSHNIDLPSWEIANIKFQQGYPIPIGQTPAGSLILRTAFNATLRRKGL